jgi:hypothetical protein
VVQVQADVREWIKDVDSERAAFEAFLASDARTAPDPATLARTEDEIAQARPCNRSRCHHQPCITSNGLSCNHCATPRQLHAEEKQLLGELDGLASEQERLQAAVADLERESAEVRALEEQYAATSSHTRPM